MTEEQAGWLLLTIFIVYTILAVALGFVLGKALA